MSYTFTIVSALLAAGLVLWTLRRHISPEDWRKAVYGFLCIFTSTGLLGASGLLDQFERRPPPFVFFLLALLSLGTYGILSPWGRRVAEQLPLRLMIGLQGFRLLPELLLHFAYQDGLAPVQMTWHGRNFDVVSALLALGLAWIWPRLSRPRLWAWLFNALGFALLVNILAIAILSAPLPFRVFMNEPANTFVTHFPYIWLPAVHVLIALVLHGLTLRRLIQESR